MNYLLKFGIERNPFIKNDNDEKIDLLNTGQLLFRLRHLEETKGIWLITGEPGLGKSTTIRHWAKSLNTNLYKVIYISHSTVSVHEFYREICYQMGLEEYYSKRKNLNEIQNEIKRLSIEKRITPVIILDEANYLSASVLNDLKILLNFDMDSKEPYILLLIGQVCIRDTINRKSYDSLKQRISMIYNFEPMDREESEKYINSKLAIAGANKKILSNEAYNTIIDQANGVPRIINQIMDKALVLMENKKLDMINETIMSEAIDEIKI